MPIFIVILGPVSVSYELASHTAICGMPVEIAVSLDGDPMRQITASLSTDYNGGMESDDLTSIPASLNFNAGYTRKAFTVSSVDSASDNADMEFRELFGAVNAEGLSQSGL